MDFIFGALAAIAGLIVFAGGSLLSSMFSAANSGVGSGIAAGIGAILGVICLAFAALLIITGIGLLKLRGWGRIIAIVLSVLGVLNSIRGFAGGGLHMGGSALVFQLVFLVYYVWSIWYLLTPGVKAAFAGQPAVAA